MRQRPMTLAQHLSRSLAVAGLVYAVILGYAVPVALLAKQPTALELAEPGPSPTGPAGTTPARDANRAPAVAAEALQPGVNDGT